MALTPENSQAVADSTRSQGKASEPSERFLRFSHIFASVVRDILEVKLLEEVAPHPLTLSQFHLLKAVAFNGAYHVGDVASFLGVSAPAGTKNIDKLERLGLVVRTPSRLDRRVTLLSASPKGRRLVRKYEARKADRLAPVLEQFSTAEISRLGALLERFSLSLIKREESNAGLCLWCAAYDDEHCSVGKVRGGCPYQRLREAHPAHGEVGNAR